MDVTSMGATFERVDELPILLHGLQPLKLAGAIDTALSPPHGNRRGVSDEQQSVLLVAFVMRQAEQRLCAVEEWVKTHPLTLSRITGWEIGEKDDTDAHWGITGDSHPLGDVGHPAFYHQMAQADQRFTNEVESHYSTIEHPLLII